MIVPLNEKVNTLFSKSVYISQVVSSVLQMYHNAKAVLNALRKHYKFPKVLINVLVIFHLLHSTPKSLLCSWPAQIMTQAPQLGARNGSHWHRPTNRGRRGQGASPPSLPASKPAPLGPPPQCPLSALLISGE